MKRDLAIQEHVAFAMQAICRCCGMILEQRPLRDRRRLIVATDTVSCDSCVFDNINGKCSIHVGDMKQENDIQLIALPS